MIPWDLVWPFLEKLLGGLCPAKDIKQLSREHPVYVEGRLRRHLIDQGVSRKEASLIAQASRETIDRTSAAELATLA